MDDSQSLHGLRVTSKTTRLLIHPQQTGTGYTFWTHKREVKIAVHCVGDRTVLFSTLTSSATVQKTRVHPFTPLCLSPHSPSVFLLSTILWDTT